MIKKRIGDRDYFVTAYMGHITSSADTNDGIQFHRRQDAELVANELVGPDYGVVEMKDE